MSIPFTQYLMPNGYASPNSVERPPEVEAKAQQAIAAGLRFECEMLSDWQTISLTAFDPKINEDIATEVVQNGPAVPDAVDRLVERALIYATTKAQAS